MSRRTRRRLRRVVRVVAPIVAGFAVGPLAGAIGTKLGTGAAVSGALAGGVIGGGTAALTGGNVGRGILLGGATGGIGAGVSGALGNSMPQWATSGISGAAAGGAAGAISGGDWRTGALLGGAAGAAGGYLQGRAAAPQAITDAAGNPLQMQAPQGLEGAGVQTQGIAGNRAGLLTQDQGGATLLADAGGSMSNLGPITPGSPMSIGEQFDSQNMVSSITGTPSPNVALNPYGTQVGGSFQTPTPPTAGLNPYGTQVGGTFFGAGSTSPAMAPGNVYTPEAVQGAQTFNTRVATQPTQPTQTQARTPEAVYDNVPREQALPGPYTHTQQELAMAGNNTLMGELKDRFSDPRNYADLLLRGAGLLFMQQMQGAPPEFPQWDDEDYMNQYPDVANLMQGLSPEEIRLLEMQYNELLRLQAENEELFRQKVGWANDVWGEHEYFDPEYFGLQRQRQSRTASSRRERERKREEALTGRAPNEARARQAGLDEDLLSQSMYLQGADWAQQQRLNTMRTAHGMLPNAFPNDLAAGLSDVRAGYGGGYDRLTNAWRDGTTENRLRYAADRDRYDDWWNNHSATNEGWGRLFESFTSRA